MQGQVTKVVTLTLVLTEEEAKWLHRVMQNPLFGDDPFKEPHEDAEMRKLFFAATKIY